jgi:hypothetical protein
MKKLIKKTLMLLLAGAITAVFGVTVFAEDVPESVVDARDGVVRIVTYDGDEGVGIASGFIIAKENGRCYIISNLHAVLYETRSGLEIAPYVLILNKDIDTDPIEVDTDNIVRIEADGDTELDMVLITVDEKLLKDNIVLPIRGADDLRDGEAIYTLGFPAVADNALANNNLPSSASDVTITDGIISKTGVLFAETEESYNEITVQHTATINGGNSGGPLLDKNGAVIGVNTWYTAAQGPYFSGISDYIIDYANDYDIPITLATGETKRQEESETERAKRTERQEETEEAMEAPIEAYENPASGVNIMSIAIVVLVIIIVVSLIIIIAVVSKPKAAAAAPAAARVRPAAKPTPTPTPAPIPTPPPAPTPVAAPRASFDKPQTDYARDLPAGAAAPIPTPIPAPTPVTVRTITIAGTAGYFRGREFSTQSVLTFGRRATNDIAFPPDTNGVSGDHCEIRVEGSKATVIDKKSSYGTFVNGMKLQPFAPETVIAGDKIRLASEEQEFMVL